MTKSGETICDFSYSSVKQPFEFLIFGCLNENLSTKIPDKKIIMSVPSAIHSHKPPIVGELWFKYLNIYDLYYFSIIKQ